MNENNVTIEQIATTEDTDEPVFKAACGGAHMTFIFPTEEPQDVWVQTVRSPEPGGMKAMLDHVCREYACREVRFVNVLNDNVKEKLDGATVVEETIPEPNPAAGETITCVDVVWGGVES